MFLIVFNYAYSISFNPIGLSKDGEIGLTKEGGICCKKQKGPVGYEVSDSFNEVLQGYNTKILLFKSASTTF